MQIRVVPRKVGAWDFPIGATRTRGRVPVLSVIRTRVARVPGCRFPDPIPRCAKVKLCKGGRTMGYQLLTVTITIKQRVNVQQYSKGMLKPQV